MKHLTAVACALACALAAVLVQAQARPADTSVEDARLTAFLDKAFDDRARLRPEYMTSLGLKTDYGKLDDYTAAADERALALLRSQLAALQRDFQPARLGDQARLSYSLFARQVEQAEENARWRAHGFIFTANGSPAGGIAAFLINNHRVDTVQGAEAYIARLREVERVMNEIVADFLQRTENGITTPRLVFEPAIADARKVIAGAPFTAGADTAVWADFKGKVGALAAADAATATLLDNARAALTGPFKRGYDTAIAALEAAAPRAAGNDGVWRLPDGAAYYANRVKNATTTDLTPDQIHQIGLDELTRLQAEMEAVKARVGFTGTLQQFFAFVKAEPRFHYPNTDEGREQYLADARALLAQVQLKAPAFFHRLPKAPLEVRAVEKWREATASVAFYNRGTADGSRPGIFYVNLSDLRETLKPQIEGISYHEGAPGHHFQISFAQEQEGLPKFRRFGGYGAYSEGWGLYAEWLGKEMGFYQDPYADLARLSLEAWRAVRLVVDTGIHARRWSRERAVAFFTENTMLSDLDARREIDRYITSPGQATSYKIGQLRILALRRKAEAALGTRFDVRDFHAAVLSDGALPLDLLEARVDAYIARGKA